MALAPDRAAPAGARGPLRQIPQPLPGVGHIALDGVPEAVRVRFAHVTDDHIADLVGRFIQAASTSASTASGPLASVGGEAA